MNRILPEYDAEVQCPVCGHRYDPQHELYLDGQEQSEFCPRCDAEFMIITEVAVVLHAEFRGWEEHSLGVTAWDMWQEGWSDIWDIRLMVRSCEAQWELPEWDAHYFGHK